MECKGKLKSLSKNWLSGKWELTFEIEENLTRVIESIKEKELSICAKEYRKRRSLDANAYYWQLIAKLAEALELSKNRTHNLMLARYGQLEEYDGKLVYVVLPDTPEGTEKALEADTYHLKPTSEVQAGNDGTLFRTYKMLRGSSSYNTKEMSILINGLINECNQMGIETLLPEKVEGMLQSYTPRK